MLNIYLLLTSLFTLILRHLNPTIITKLVCQAHFDLHVLSLVGQSNNAFYHNINEQWPLDLSKGLIILPNTVYLILANTENI